MLAPVHDIDYYKHYLPFDVTANCNYYLLGFNCCILITILKVPTLDKVFMLILNHIFYTDCLKLSLEMNLMNFTIFHILKSLGLMIISDVNLSSITQVLFARCIIVFELLLFIL